MILDRFRLDGQKAIVTGGAKGLGQAVARALAEAGADIALVSRTDNPKFQQEILEMGRKCIHYAVDLGNRAAVRGVISDVVAILGDIDILVNNSGIITRSEIVDFSEKNWDETLELNVTSAFFLSQAAGRHMIKKGRGKIINIASILSFQGGIYVPAYTASKHAVLGITRALCNAWASKGVNVNAIAPGFFETDMTAALRKNQERLAAIGERIPAGRWGRPEDIAGPALFLASSASDFVHGAVIPVDGGWMAW